MNGASRRLRDNHREIRQQVIQTEMFLEKRRATSRRKIEKQVLMKDKSE